MKFGKPVLFKTRKGTTVLVKKVKPNPYFMKTPPKSFAPSKYAHIHPERFIPLPEEYPSPEIKISNGTITKHNAGRVRLSKNPTNLALALAKKPTSTQVKARGARIRTKRREIRQQGRDIF